MRKSTHGCQRNQEEPKPHILAWGRMGRIVHLFSLQLEGNVVGILHSQLNVRFQRNLGQDHSVPVAPLSISHSATYAKAPQSRDWASASHPQASLSCYFSHGAALDKVVLTTLLTLLCVQGLSLVFITILLMDIQMNWSKIKHISE